MQSPGRPTDVIGVHLCANPFEAAFLKAYLESEGVTAWYDGEDARGFTGRYAIVGRGVYLRVHKKDAKRARALLERAPAPQEADEDADGRELAPEAHTAPSVPGSCPNCGSTHVARVKTPRWLVFLLLGLPCLFHGKSWNCPQCGWEWTP